MEAQVIGGNMGFPAEKKNPDVSEVYTTLSLAKGEELITELKNANRRWWWANTKDEAEAYFEALQDHPKFKEHMIDFLSNPYSLRGELEFDIQCICENVESQIDEECGTKRDDRYD